MGLQPKCIVILSTKSAGSSALQTLLCRFGGGRHAVHTRHGEMETLYWTKAASTLGLPQIKLPDSEVPLPRKQAERELREFIAQNAPGFAIPVDPTAMIFSGWRELCMRHAPVFIEKSPHHLHEWPALELLARAVREQPDIDYRFVGLVRNPMDYLYSAWDRWRTPPEALQKHWGIAHNNLLRWRDTVGEKLFIVRYEELVAQPATVRQLFDFAGLKPVQPGIETFLRTSSLLKWKADGQFGFQLDTSVAQMARAFGYSEFDLHNETRPGWYRHRRIARATYLARTPLEYFRRLVRSFVSRRSRLSRLKQAAK